MFVLCPHCHFLVGIDPRTGAPPAHCPKCSGVVVAPLPPSSDEEAPGAGAAVVPLDPFATPALPSLAPDTPVEALPEPGPGPQAPASAQAVSAPPAPPPDAPIEALPESIATSPPEPQAPATAEAAPAKVRKSRARARRSDDTDATRPVPPDPVGVQEPGPAGDAQPIEAGRVPASAVAAAMLPPAGRAEEIVAPTGESMPAPVEAVSPDVADARGTRAVTDGLAQTAPTAATPTTAQRPRAAPSAMAPSFIRGRSRQGIQAGWRSLAVVTALALLLVLQLLLAQRETLAADARWRPTIAGLCGALGCTVPPWREPTAFTMLSRDVRPHPSAQGTLLINASFRNDARWPQPWPELLLTLSDLDGRMVGARAFAAGEYLDGAPTQNELAPGQTAAVTLAVVEPAPNVVAFTFDFR